MLKLEQARAFARQVVEEQGADFVYNTQGAGTNCFYAPLSEVRAMGTAVDRRRYDAPDNREKTGCLVGRILDLAGETRHREERNVSKAVDDLSRTCEGMMSQRAREYLSYLQGSQDTGHSWGVALEHAEAQLFRLENYPDDK